MSLNEAIIKDAALEWFGERGYAIVLGPNLAPDEPSPELGQGFHGEHRPPNIQRRSEEKGWQL